MLSELRMVQDGNWVRFSFDPITHSVLTFYFRHVERCFAHL